MWRRSCALFSIVVLVGAMGCGAELGLTGASASADPPVALMTASGQLQNTRESDAILGARMNAKTTSARPFQIRSVTVDAGYRWVASRKYRLGAELALELGGGQPSTIDYRSIGVYTGARTTLLFRMFGMDDLEPRYTVLAKGLNLAFTLRGGTWATPEDSTRQTTVGEIAATFGLRFDIGSDLGPTYPQTVAP
jgi:hypothetical protein